MKWNFFGKRDAVPVVAVDEGTKAAHTFTSADLGLNYNFMHGNPLTMNGGIDGAYGNSWVAYSCIRAIAQDVSGVPLLFLSDPDDPESSVPESHPTRKMFENPSSYFSTAELIQWVFTLLNMRGEFFVIFDDVMRPTKMLPQLDPKHWRDVTNGMDLDGWVYQSGNTTLPFLPDELIHGCLIDPNNPFRGQSPLKAATTQYGIQSGVDKLTLDVVGRGGEKSLMFDAGELGPTQRQQAALALRSRRRGIATVASDVILPEGIKPLSTSFTDDDLELLATGADQPGKICAVYGVPRSRIDFGAEEKYANAQVKKRIYYESTLVPQANGVESAFDRMFVNTLVSAYRCYVRFDWSKVPAMQDDLAERFTIAGNANKAGVPWVVLNETFKLGLDTDKIPGADTVLVSSTLAPADKLISEWATTSAAPSSQSPTGAASEPGKSVDGDGGRAGLTNKIIRKRATNTRSAIQRNKRLNKSELEFKRQWRSMLQKVMVKAEKAAGNIKTASGVNAALAPVFKGLGEKMAAVAVPHHESAAREGQRAIVEIAEGKMSDQDLNLMKQFKWSPGVEDLLRKRRNRVVKMGDDLFENIKSAVSEAVIDGAETAEIETVVRKSMSSLPGGINRANVIARTEIGTAYNGARHAEIKDQGFEWHTWLTAGDDEVRDGPEADHASSNDVTVKVGDLFPSGLRYPQEEGGDAANVINCRCEAIPSLKGPK